MDACGEVPHLGTFLEQAIDEAIPLAMHWDITWRCDHRCVHCYLTKRRQPELSLAEGIDLLDQLAAAGTMMLLISGGDPFLRKDAMDIIRAARDRDFAVSINTHGNFIDDALADALAEVGIHKVNISVYSADSGPHERITQIKGSHAKSLAAARRLVERGIPVTFKTPVMQQNRLGFYLVEALAASMGATWEMDASLIPDDKNDFGLYGEQGVAGKERVAAVLYALKSSRDLALPLAEQKPTPSTARTCSAGATSGHITPDGQVLPCILWRDPLGSIREHSFKTLWLDTSKAEEIRTIRRGSYQSECGDCAFNSQCAYCPGLSHAETGRADRRSEYVCDRTHAQMSAIEHMVDLKDQDLPVPTPGTDEAAALMRTQTFADRNLAAHRPARAATEPGLVQISESQ